MKAKYLFLLLLTVATVMVSCDDTTDEMGSSLTPTTDRLSVNADTFSVTSRTIVPDYVTGNNTTGYLGRVKDPETGNVVTASFMSQFHLLDGYQLPAENRIMSRDANGKVVADSCQLQLICSGYYGDSLAQMKTRAYLMGEPLEENSTYNSAYDPIADGKVNPQGFYQDKSYTIADLTDNDSLRATSSYANSIRINLSKPYTKDGVTYNNFGSYLMRQYYEHPEYFTSSYNFIHNVVPGFYFKNTGGVGSMAYINTTLLIFYFNCKNDADSVISASSSFAGTEEVLQTSSFANDRERLNELAADNSCTYLKTPAGLYTEVTLPVEQIMSGHENDTVNTARLNIPRMTNQTPTVYPLDIPQSVLMIPEDSIHSFFANDRLPDYYTSFISTYSRTTNSYLFGNISGMINAMHRSHQNGNTSSNWNKVVLIPVTLQTTTTSNNKTTIVNLSNNMALTSTRLLGGSDNPDALKITVVYSKFNTK